MSRYRVAAIVAAVLVIMIDVALLDTPVTSPISATAARRHRHRGHARPPEPPALGGVDCCQSWLRSLRFLSLALT